MTRRNQQFTAELTRAIQETLARGLQDPRISGLITVTGVKVTEDLHDATVSVSVLPEQKQELTVRGLQEAAPHIRHQVGELIDARRLPILNFRLDTSLKKEAAVIRALARAAEERAAAPGDAPAPPPEEHGPHGGLAP